MRIVIEIEGAEASVAARSGADATMSRADATDVSGAPTPAGSTAPPEVLAAAAALGARNGGPAPAPPAAAPGFPAISPAANEGAPAAFTGGTVATPNDLSAGAAPGAAAEAASVETYDG